MMSKKFTIELDYDFMDKIVVESLKDSADSLVNEISRLEAIESRKPFQEEDLQDSIRNLEHIKGALKYYMYISDYEKLFPEG